MNQPGDFGNRQSEISKGGQSRQTNSRVNTTPHRLSALPGEKMNQFAGFENRKSQKQ
jgi:hypothetical protein